MLSIIIAVSLISRLPPIILNTPLSAQKPHGLLSHPPSTFCLWLSVSSWFYISLTNLLYFLVLHSSDDSFRTPSVVCAIVEPWSLKNYKYRTTHHPRIRLCPFLLNTDEGFFRILSSHLRVFCGIAFYPIEYSLIFSIRYPI